MDEAVMLEPNTKGNKLENAKDKSPYFGRVKSYINHFVKRLYHNPKTRSEKLIPETSSRLQKSHLPIVAAFPLGGATHLSSCANYR